MSLKEKERAKEQQEKFQAILSALLKDEDNKYCVDCDAKGPRWASWNLGIFLCIRCAGIHRNLGVHISRVKSVNLDTWTAEQVAMMQEIGNSRARAVYEANIPDGFRRPQSDSALEAFVRAKYEQKKYIAREWIPPTPKVPKEFVSDEWLEDSKNEKKKARSKPASGSQIQLGGMGPKAAGKPSTGVSSGDSNTRPVQPVKTEVKLPQAAKEPAAPISAASDLLGLDLSSPHNPQAVAPAAQSSGNELLDLFGGPQPGSGPSAVNPSANNDLMNGSSSEANLFEGEGSGEEKKTSTKDSIMALFGGTGGGGGGAPAPSQQMYNIPASSVTPTQNGTAVPVVASAAAVMSGFGSNVYNPSMMSSSLVLPTSYSAQHGMIHHGVADQSKHLGHVVSSLTNHHQQPSTSLPALLLSNPQSTISNQQPMGQSLFNPPAVGSQNSNFIGSVQHQQQCNPSMLSSNHQQLHVSTNVTALGPNQSGQVQSLMSTKSATASSVNQHLQSSFSGMTTMAGIAATETKVGAAVMPGYGQNLRPPMYYGQAQTSIYGGMYMPQGQQAFPGMMVQPQNMMGQPQNMMGYQPNLMGQQPQGMMGTPTMNGSQMGMYNNAMMPGTQGGMYTPQQMQQLQFQQMQQQMAAMNMGGPQQMQGGWGGNPGTGQTLSNNLWQ